MNCETLAIKIFFVNLINDIDNGLILSSLLKRYKNYYPIKYIFIALYASLVLAITRTCYIFVGKSITEFPGIRLVSGLILIFMAYRMTNPNDNIDVYRLITTTPVIKLYLKIKDLMNPMIRLFFLLIATDFAISLDTVIMISQISDNLLFTSLGIFLSLFLVLLFFKKFIEMTSIISWLNIIIAGFLTQVAVLSISHDPYILQWFIHLKSLIHPLQETNTSKVYNIIALDAAILMILTGILRKFKN